MEQSIEYVNLLVSGATGPLTKQLDAYIAWLDRNQYAISLMRIKVLQVLAFDRWLERRNIALGNLNKSHILRYQRRLSRRYGSRRYGLRHIETRRRELFNLEQLLDFLRQQGACALSPAAQQTPIDIIASKFEHHLRSERGLANETVSRYTTTARQFLADRFGTDPVSLHSLLPTDVIEFIRRQTTHLQPSAVKCEVTGLRSFLRYAQYCGEISSQLVASVPSVATWTTTPKLPKAISAEHAKRAIDSCDIHTADGLRDRAVLLILSRLGLRAGEVIKLRLDDIDWDVAQLRVHGKGRHESLLPLPADVGKAIAAYLKSGRPASDDRSLFLRSIAPIRGLKEDSDAVGSIVSRALRRAKVDSPHKGSHQFRHALAVGMLQRGASLSEIGEVLRHRSPQSTSIYARVDVEALRTIAFVWPGEAK
jgi:site-specific recombinase XerD